MPTRPTHLDSGINDVWYQTSTENMWFNNREISRVEEKHTLLWKEKKEDNNSLGLRKKRSRALGKRE